MKLTSIQEQLIFFLKELNSHYNSDELAFLALTSKSEAAIRDKVAYLLYKALLPEGFHVSREWCKVDLAVLSGKKPVALLEFKAMYTFDCGKAWQKLSYPELVIKDLFKAQKLAEEGTEIFGVLLATHISNYVPYELGGIVKYINDINFAARNTIVQNLAVIRTENNNYVADAAVKSVISYFKERNINICCGAVEAGTAYSLPVSVHFFIIGPVYKNTVLKL